MSLTNSEVSYFAGRASALEQRDEDQRWQMQAAELRKPLPRLDDPLVQVEVIEAFRVAEAGRETRSAEPGDVVRIPKSLAHSLAGIGRCKFL